MRSKGYKCSNVKCNSCIAHCMCGELGDAALDCVNRVATSHTNADRIRTMSDEELAELFEGLCYDSMSHWLQQPAEEDDHA